MRVLEIEKKELRNFDCELEDLIKNYVQQELDDTEDEELVKKYYNGESYVLVLTKSELAIRYKNEGVPKINDIASNNFYKVVTEGNYYEDLNDITIMINESCTDFKVIG